MPTKTTPAPRWLAGILLTILASMLGIYTQYVSAAIQQRVIADQKIEMNQVYFDSGLEMIDGKLELLLQERGITYTGPTYHRRFGPDTQAH